MNFIAENKVSKPSSSKGPVKKRHRVAVVCLPCKRKKIKCDKNKPECNNCLKANVKCQYQDIVWASSTSVDEEGKVTSYNEYSGEKIFLLNNNGLVPFKGKDPAALENTLEGEQVHAPKLEENTVFQSNTKSDLPLGHPSLDPSETLNFYEGALSNDEIVRAGPFSWFIFASKDPYIRYMWLLGSQSEEMKLLYLGSNLNNEGKKQSGTQEAPQNLKNLRTKSVLPCSYQPLPFAELEFRVLKNLPTKRALWIAVNRFREYIYPYLSFVIWDEFTAAVTECLDTIVNDTRDENFTNLNIKKQESLCHLAILLIVMRLGYLSILEDPPHSNPDVRYMEENPISIDIIFTSQILLNQFNIFDKPPLELLEAYIYLRSYHHYSPDQGDNTGIYDTTVFNGMIISLATSLGLSRDPSTIVQFQNDIKVCNLRRRIWNFVVAFDVFQMTSLGSPVVYSGSHARIKLPAIIGDQAHMEEDHLTQGLSDFVSGTDVIKGVAALAVDAHAVPIYELAKGIKRIDQLKNEKFKSLADIIHQKFKAQESSFDRLRRVIHLIKYVFFNTFCFTIEYNIFLHFEEKTSVDKSLAKYYFTRIVERSNETLKYLPPLMIKSSEYFGYGLDSMHYPAILLSVHKALQVQASLSLRCQHALKAFKIAHNKSKDAREVQTYLKCIVRNISHQMENYLRYLDHACTKYQYAWRLKRPHTLFWIISSRECFDIKNGEVVSIAMNGQEEIKFAGANVLKSMTLSDLKKLYPLSEDEISSMRRKSDFHRDSLQAATSPSVKDERSPSISNLLNNVDYETSSSTSSFIGSPKANNMKNIVDPDIDRNWIKLLYTESSDYDDQLHSLQRQASVQHQQPPQQPMHHQQVASHQVPPQASMPFHPSNNTQSQGAPINNHHQQNIPIHTQAHPQQAPYVDAARRYGPNDAQPPPMGQQFPFAVQAAPSQAPNQYTPGIQSMQHPHQQESRFSRNSAFENAAQWNSGHEQGSSADLTKLQSNTNLSEFFNLIGAGGFSSSLDEMFGPVGFYE